jgi:hypothetical protein
MTGGRGRGALLNAAADAVAGDPQLAGRRAVVDGDEQDDERGEECEDRETYLPWPWPWSWSLGARCAGGLIDFVLAGVDHRHSKCS